MRSRKGNHGGKIERLREQIERLAEEVLAEEVREPPEDR